MSLTKLLVMISVCFITFSVQATQTVIVETPSGGQTVCIAQGGYITCF